MYMKIRSKISFSDYLKLCYTLTYKNRANIVVSLIALSILLFSLQYFFTGRPALLGRGPIISLLIFVGLFTLIQTPLLVYFAAKKNYQTSQKIRDEIEYEFTKERFAMTGNSFTSEMGWDTIYKIHELDRWFLIYQNGMVANPISKRDLSAEQVDSLRQLFRSLRNVQLKLF